MNKILIGFFAVVGLLFSSVAAYGYTIPAGYLKDCPFKNGTIQVRTTSPCPDPLKQCTIFPGYTVWLQTYRDCPVVPTGATL